MEIIENAFTEALLDDLESGDSKYPPEEGWVDVDSYPECCCW